ncbi:hypothetical protein BBO99_00002443 [Phytophthora kernoviae]|uniref:ZZ-type domain-containing protein n=2 Tax=Phytophthora kernoviae TaxID=325452 RepID=A0A421F9S1_9STRA|nr:hypothetical protein G195_004201 [Phytophthora kernoviae 00238/432]KAG2527127.1 hypothetical protein JM16_001914 [Phytophthora kernoviae]KAG2528554.1 hypothetical protein JM18_002016 [Phytophthora kernoviae]RLN31825.1 hypothetical protein BBI17_000513 [Phytophthora kernoviae]RLN83076.1 hypothetical protein BBO99_00002443 [Phytophthora kernoviae]
MSLFSLPNVLRRSVPSDGSDNGPAVRPSIISTQNLNAQLEEEAKHVDQHLFFGPQQTMFEGERQRVIHGERKIQKNNKRFWLMSDPLSMEKDSTTSLIGFPTDSQMRPGGIGSKMSAATRFIGQKVAAMKFPPSHVNEDSFCDGCGMDPIVGNMYSCSKCVNYSLFNTLEVRGIEIPHLDLETRATLVKLLTPVLADRTDLEVCMEWFCPDVDNMDLPGVQRRMETIRIWVATDKDSKSPFVTKEGIKDDDTEPDMSPVSNSGDVMNSPGPGSPVMSPKNSESPCVTPPPSPTVMRRKSTGATSMTSESSSQVSPPRLDTLTAADKVADYSYEDDDEEYLSDSVKSDIEPRKVASLSPSSGQRSEGIEM